MRAGGGSADQAQYDGDRHRGERQFDGDERACEQKVAEALEVDHVDEYCASMTGARGARPGRRISRC
ncbi:MAG: hypothetical protein P8Z69_06065 [Acidihalobacter sp.]